MFGPINNSYFGIIQKDAARSDIELCIGIQLMYRNTTFDYFFRAGFCVFHFYQPTIFTNYCQTRPLAIEQIAL